MSFSSWARKVERSRWEMPQRSPPVLGLTTRAIPGVACWQPIVAEVGEQAAQVSISDAIIHHPCPYDEFGVLTQDCREWIVASVRAASERDQRVMSITWPEGATTQEASDELLGKVGFVKRAAVSAE